MIAMLVEVLELMDEAAKVEATGSGTFRGDRGLPPAGLREFPFSLALAMGSVELLNVPEVTVQSPVLLQQFLAHSPDFVENRIGHD